MPTSYLPLKQADLLEFSQNLFDRLEANPESFGTSAEGIAPFAVAFNAFKAAYALMLNPATKNKVTVADKDEKKAAMIAAIRQLVASLQASPVMTNAKREELRITARGNEPTPIGPPQEMPVLRVEEVSGRVMDLEVLNLENQKRKPAGV
ncbi:unnamed protein product, partial [Ectocarpus fasciculatus]